jgi:tetrapyrrole methylase family protein/MazG family protein
MNGITILGLGPGSAGQLTLEAWEVLKNAGEVYLRTKKHPTVASLPAGLSIQSFDHFYEQEKDFSRVYQRIVETVLELGQRPEGVVYAVPGHPYIAEATGPEIIRQAEELGLAGRVVDGLSFIEPIFTALRIDPLPQTVVIDALELVSAYYPSFPPDVPVLIAQLYSSMVAGEVKITLMEQYPDEHLVFLIHGAGTSNQIVEKIPLYQIDQSDLRLLRASRALSLICGLLRAVHGIGSKPINLCVKIYWKRLMKH